MQTLIPRQAVLSLSPGGVQAVQALIPKQAELVTSPLVYKGSPVSGLPGGDSSSGFWWDLSHSLGQVQAVDSLLSRPPHPQKVLIVKIMTFRTTTPSQSGNC